MTDAAAVTRTLARYVVNAKYDDIPGDVRHEAKRALLNWLGCAIGAAHHETIKRALAALAPFAGAPQAALLGRSERFDILKRRHDIKASDIERVELRVNRIGKLIALCRDAERMSNVGVIARGAAQ